MVLLKDTVSGFGSELTVLIVKLFYFILGYVIN